MFEYHDIRTGKDGQAEYQTQEPFYQTTMGNGLYLYEHPITHKFYGTSVGEVESLRQEFIQRLRRDIDNLNTLRTEEKLERIAKRLFCIFHKKQDVYLQLPADTHPGLNTSTLSEHAILTSSLSVCMIRGLRIRNKGVQEIVGEDIELSDWGLIHIGRIAAFCHDLGKHPPQNHVQRSVEAFEEIFSSIFTSNDAALKSIIQQAILRHHSGHYSSYLPETLFEKVICYADTASSADRIKTVREEDAEKDLMELRQKKDGKYQRYIIDAERLQRLTSSMNQFELDIFGSQPPVALASADTDRIKSYVFESVRLPEVRGGSRILDNLNRNGIERILHDFALPKECILYAAGGGAVLMLPSGITKDICEAIERKYLEETQTATITTVSRSYHLVELQYGLSPITLWFDEYNSIYEDATTEMKTIFDTYFRLDDEFCSPHEKTRRYQAFLKRKRFGELITVLGYELRRKKDERSDYPLFESPPYARRCDSCEIRPAEKLYPKAPEELWLCEVCSRKRQHGQDEKTMFVCEFEDYARKEEYAQSAYAQGWAEINWGPVEVSQDLDEIANAARERKAADNIGVIYADGNDIGGFLEGMSTPAEYRAVAEMLVTGIEKAVYQSLASYLPGPTWVKETETRRRKLIHPFEIVSIGGDDVFLIVPADVAMPIAYSICDLFEKAFRQADGSPRLTISAGVVIAHKRFPIYYLREIAEQLCKSAKKLAKKCSMKKCRTSAVDFMVLTSGEPLSMGLEDFREKAYKGRFLGERLTERPYTLPRLKQLQEIALKFKEEGFPRSQLYAFRESVSNGMLVSRLFYRYQRTRMKEEYRTLLETFEKTWWDADSTDWAPWTRREHGNLTTPILDLVEIYNYLRANGEEGEDR